MNPSTYYYEAKLCEALGISRDELIAYRRVHLKKNSGDWKMLGRQLVISASALDRFLADWIKKTGAVPAATALLSCAVNNQEKNHAPAPPLNELELVVKRRYPNVHLLLAADPASGRELRVWVTDNNNFRPDMKLKARAQGPGKPHRLVGRCPRYPGRW
jgi:hypothetical protein